MPRDPKLHTTKTLVDVSFRTEDGLPFAPNRLIRRLVENVLARAQTMHPITIVKYVIMPNHVHILVVIKDSKDFVSFIEYFKKETAHYVNRLLGRRRHTVWCAGYSDPVILDSESALRRLVYIDTNPVKSKFTETSKNYPLSSSHWVDPNNDSSEITVRRIPRNKAPKLPHRDLTLQDIDKACSKLEYRGNETYTLRVEPNAWKECFADTIHKDSSELNKLLSADIRQHERRISKEIGGNFNKLEALATQNIRKQYQPKKFGKKMLCIGKDKETRVKYLEWYYARCKELPSFIKKKSGEALLYIKNYPPGFFSPGGFLSANILPELYPFSFLT